MKVAGAERVTLSGGCHCGAVRYRVTTAVPLEVEDCNCSICAKSGYLHLIVPRADFELVSGDEALTDYRFNSGVARHRFCGICGVKSFYIPRSNPDGIDVNVRTLDHPPPAMLIAPFDGENWEANAHRLAHKSQPQEPAS